MTFVLAALVWAFSVIVKLQTSRRFVPSSWYDNISTQNLHGSVEAEGYYRRIRRVRSRHSLKEKVWLPGKTESFNILVAKNFVSHHESAASGKLQYYYPEHVARERCNHAK